MENVNALFISKIFFHEADLASSIKTPLISKHISYHNFTPATEFVFPDKPNLTHQ